MKKIFIFLLIISNLCTANSSFTNIPPEVLKVAVKAHNNVKKELSVSNKIVVVDFTQPSNKQRLWVIDVKNKKELLNTHVTHGKNSGLLKTESFSNKNNSFKSSFGVFVTGEKYIGKHGKSLRLKGIEKGRNDHTFKRNIVIHGTKYANKDFLEKYGRLGRSLGCFAVSTEEVSELVDLVGENTVLVAYTDDKAWLKKSKYLA